MTGSTGGLARLQRIALVAAGVATAPYLLLKAAWLSGSTVGTTSVAGAAEMSGTRFVAGNVVTVLLMLVAVAFVAALTRPWGRRVPSGLVLLLGAGATGLLAPILLGLPLGLVIQLATQGGAAPKADTGLAPWVFALVYGGFGLLAVAMAVLLAGYVVSRWGALIAQPPPRPAPVITAIGALGLLPFGAAMLWWGIVGPGSTGPQGMEPPAQRTVLVVTGVLSAAAFVVPLIAGSARRWPRLAWLVTWTGCCVAALQGPTQVLLAQGGTVQPVVATIGLISTVGASSYGLGVLRRRVDEPAVAGAQRVGTPTAEGPDRPDRPPEPPRWRVRAPSS